MSDISLKPKQASAVSGVTAQTFHNLPKGRKNPKWKAAFLRSLEGAAADLGEISEQQISREVAKYRKSRKRLPEITIAKTPKKTA